MVYSQIEERQILKITRCEIKKSKQELRLLVTFVKKLKLKTNPNKGIIIWLLTGCFLVYVMVIVGCITRLTHSGLSITDWNFMGTLPPFSEEAWMDRFSKYQESPEFKIINSTMQLQEFKSIFWWEYIHRMIGRFIGFVFISGFLYFLIRKKFNTGLIRKMLVLLGLGMLQGLIGWWMVKSGLVKDPAVSHYRLATHLMSAFTVFAFTFWYALELLNVSEESEATANSDSKLKGIILLTGVVTIMQLIYGAFVAGLKAGLYYPTWPKMGNEWFPEETILTSDSVIKDFTENGAGVQFIHRTLAWVVVAMVIVLWVRSAGLRKSLSKGMYNGITMLIYLLTAQIMLGIFTLLYSVPVVLGVLHQTVAFFIFANLVFLVFKSFRKVA